MDGICVRCGREDVELFGVVCGDCRAKLNTALAKTPGIRQSWRDSAGTIRYVEGPPLATPVTTVAMRAKRKRERQRKRAARR